MYRNLARIERARRETCSRLARSDREEPVEVETAFSTLGTSVGTTKRCATSSSTPKRSSTRSLGSDSTGVTEIQFEAGSFDGWITGVARSPLGRSPPACPGVAVGCNEIQGQHAVGTAQRDSSSYESFSPSGPSSPSSDPVSRAVTVSDASSAAVMLYRFASTSRISSLTSATPSST